MLAVNGEWGLPAKSKTIPDPLNGEPFIKLPDTQLDEIDPFVQSLRAVPKSGLHNPLKNPERCAPSWPFKKFPFCLPLHVKHHTCTTFWITRSRHAYSASMHASEQACMHLHRCRICAYASHHGSNGLCWHCGRYNMYGAVIAKAAEEMRKPQVRQEPSRAVPCQQASVSFTFSLPSTIMCPVS